MEKEGKQERHVSFFMGRKPLEKIIKAYPKLKPQQT
jgi:hypothetical protein